MDEAIAHCRAGASIWPWASTDEGLDPDVVLVGIGDVVTTEVMAAADILRRELPEMRVRVVNVTDLLILEENTEHPHGLDRDMFHALFTPDRPVIVNFHGYFGGKTTPLRTWHRQSLDHQRLSRRGHDDHPLRHAGAQRREPLPPRPAGDPRRRPAQPA
ncbi:MAG: Curved DNA-binding protein (42 kDa protein), partial [Chaenotheca gracillima]